MKKLLELYKSDYDVQSVTKKGKIFYINFVNRKDWQDIKQFKADNRFMVLCIESFIEKKLGDSIYKGAR